MSNFLKKRASLIIFIVVIVIDYHFNFLGKYVDNDLLERLIMLLGCFGFAVTTKPNLTTSIFADDENDIGGGGIKNPKNGN